MFREQDHNPDHYAQQKSLFGDEPATPHPKGFREELHAREKDNIPNPNRHPGQFAPKGGSNPLLKVIEHEHGWTASSVLKDGKEFRVEGRDRREAIGNAVRAGEKMGVIFDPPKAEPAIGGLFGGSFDEKAHPRHKAGDSDGGQFAAKNEAEDAPFALQQPKRKPAVMSFDNNANTKQAALFDSGKKKELPGQELLFNSDAGDMHNPKTMENQAKGSEKPEETKPELTSNRLAVLKGSLEKKEKKLDDKFNAHFDDVARANGQPLNDKRNGQATLSRWDKQSDSIRNAQKEIEKTKQAIERETEKIINVSSEKIPGFLSDMVKSGELNQWRKYPNTFFVPGVDKGRIVWNEEGQFLANRYLSEVPKDQYPKFRDVFNKLNAILKESKVATSESKSQPDPMAIAQEALSNNENIGITMGRHGVTIKGHPDYRTIRQQVSEHLAELQEQAKPQPSAARQRAMDAQIQNRVANPADNYSSRVYQQFEHETERYLRDYTLYDVDRYGVGGNIMKMILSMVAMHAMSSMMGSGTSSPRKPAAQKQAPSNQDFEKLHPRAQTQAGNSKPGQFAKKPEGAAPAPAQRQVRPLTERPDLKASPRQAPPQQQQPQTPPPQTPPVEPSALETPEVPPVEAKPWIAEPNPSRGTPEQKAAQLQQRMARDQAAAQPPVQQPKDANTARIAEIWDVDTTQPDAPRNYPDNLNKPPEQQQDYAPPEHSLEGFTAQVMNNLKTPANEQDNPRKKLLLNGTPNPGYAPQDISGPERPAKIRKRAVKPAAEPTAESEPSAPSLLDMPAQSGDGNIFENPAAKARKEKAELDRVAKLEKEELARITHFDPNDFAEDGDEEEEFAEGEQFSELPPTEEQYNTPEHLQAAIDYRARRPASEDPQELAAWRKTKPETFESALKKWKARRSRHKTKTEKNIHQGDPRENIAEVAKENEFDPDSFGEYIGGMEAQEKQQWKRREKLKSDILKTWHKTSSELRDLENRKGGDAASLRGVDSLKGNLDDDQLYEFLGSDDSNWVQNAWDMVREEPPAEPGPHNREWLESHVKNFKREQSNVYQPEEYDQPEDDMPFSRRALVKSVDRYFRDARQSFRSRRSQKDSGFWTLLDAYL